MTSTRSPFATAQPSWQWRLTSANGRVLSQTARTVSTRRTLNPKHSIGICASITDQPPIIRVPIIPRQSPELGEDEDANIDRESTEAELYRYCKVYLLAAQLGDCAAANDIIDATIKYSAATQSLFVTEHITFIQDQHNNACGMYRLAVDLWAYAAKESSGFSADELLWLPRLFVARVLEEKMHAEKQGAGKLVEDVFSYEFITAEKDKYHVHSEPRPELIDDDSRTGEMGRTDREAEADGGSKADDDEILGGWDDGHDGSDSEEGGEGSVIATEDGTEDEDDELSDCSYKSSIADEQMDDSSADLDRESIAADTEDDIVLGSV